MIIKSGIVPARLGMTDKEKGFHHYWNSESMMMVLIQKVENLEFYFWQL